MSKKNNNPTTPEAAPLKTSETDASVAGTPPEEPAEATQQPQESPDPVTTPPPAETSLATTEQSAPTAPPSETALAIQGETAVAPTTEGSDTDRFNPFAPGAVEELIRVFPADERYLRQVYHPVRDEEVDKALAKLSAEQRANFEDAMLRMNPVMPGAHKRRAQAIKIFDIRVYHGTGNDESRPNLAPPGSIYSTDGRILAAGDKDQAKLLQIPINFDCFMITHSSGNTFWPPREDQGGVMPEGVEDNGAPICRSLDTEKGNRYGDCGGCQYRPFINNKPNKNACSANLTLIVIPRDFSGMYRFNFSGTNGKPGRQIVKKTEAGWRALWQHPFSLGTKKEVGKEDPSKRWFVVEPSAITDVKPTVEEAAFLHLMMRRYETEVYWPERRRIHLEAGKALPAAPSGVADMGGLAALAALKKSKAGAPAGTTVTNAAPPSDKSKNNL